MSTNPPQNLEAEQSLIGAIILDGSIMNDVSNELRASDFYGYDTAIVYSACMSLHSRSESINEISIAQELNRSNMLANIGGVGKLSHFVAQCPTSLDYPSYTALVKTCSFYRQYFNTMNNIVGKMVQNMNPDFSETLSQTRAALQSIEVIGNKQPRQLTFGKCEIIQSKPPTYTWNINGKDIGFSPDQISKWILFKARVMTELNIVPIHPDDFDIMVNNILQSSKKIEAPFDASDEYQLKYAIQQFIDQKQLEAEVYTEMQSGSHIIRKEVYGTGYEQEDYYWFLSTPLIRYLRDTYKHVFTPAELWAWLYKWRGIRNKKIQMNKQDGGQTTGTFWGLPTHFLDEHISIKPTQQSLPEENNNDVMF